MFKYEIKEEMLKRSKIKDTSNINIFINNFTNETDIIISLYWYDDNREFEYIYSGKDTIARWLKGKGYSINISTPKIVKELYKQIYNESLGK